ncbi:MAG: succinate dehydrogenase flavoprotein subunit [Chloroflexi bacterium]|nr:succinate dehydrogenase flavoprotein subunit [Chloroflexota bacterium]
MIHTIDALVVGAGGAGLYAALELSKRGVPVAVLSKMYPTRSHTGTAQGGICAALGNLEEDHWEWHMFDTIKGGDYLVDQDAAEILAREAITTIYELEHMGLPFNRTPDGRLDQRFFGGHTRPDPQDPAKRIPVHRACYAADRTGHMILQTLYQQCIKHAVNFYNEFHVLDLIVKDGVCAGVVAVEVRTGELHRFHAKAVLFATGGFGKIFSVTSNAHSLTGDGVAIAYRRGVPMMDMEFFQFHPTGIYQKGILLSEAARSEGAYLVNGKGERFMERYAPQLKELAPRDMISRSIVQEIRAGRGGDGKDYVFLDVRHLGKAVIDAKLPDIMDFVRVYMSRDPLTDLIPIEPTAHYAMGGIPTDNDARVILDSQRTPLHGFYAAGECACVSVHGANRLGTNSLVDILVFGRRAGIDMARYCADRDGVGWTELPAHPEDDTRGAITRIVNGQGGENAGNIRKQMQTEMTQKCGVFRGKDDLRSARDTISELKERYDRLSIQDKSKGFNTDLLEAMELGWLLDIAETTVLGALAREESRGGHAREDFPKRDDAHWLKHTLAYHTEDGVVLQYKPVTITTYEPQERKY